MIYDSSRYAVRLAYPIAGKTDFKSAAFCRPS